MYAVQLSKNGQLIDLYENREDAEKASQYIHAKFDIIDTTNASKVKVVYTELGGPWGYGHQEPSFTTYGGIKRCIINLYKWMKEEASFWGPDYREIKAYFRNCSLYVNGENKTDWFLKQVDQINKKIIL